MQVTNQRDWSEGKDTAKYRKSSGPAVPACETSCSQAGTRCCGRRLSVATGRNRAARCPWRAGVEQRLFQRRYALFDQSIQLGPDRLELLFGNLEAALVGGRRAVGRAPGADHRDEQALGYGRTLRLVQFA